MSTIPKYAIFYGDGSVVEGGGEDDELIEITFTVPKVWYEAPDENVQVVVVENPYTCRYVWTGNDYYFTLPDTAQENEIYSTDDLAPFHRNYMKGILKYGLCIGSQVYEDIIQKVKKYTKIPRKCTPTKEFPIRNLD